MSEPITPGDVVPGRTQDAAFDRRDWLQVTLSCIGDGVITADARGRVNYLNPVAEALTGWTLAEAAGKEDGYCESFNGKLRDEVLDREDFDALLEAKAPIE